jgi:ABC-type iron transport system FetAB ATPase subunit
MPLAGTDRTGAALARLVSVDQSESPAVRRRCKSLAPRQTPVLRVEHLQAGNLPPLSFEIADGECLAVEGPSGSGKTRLLRAIADLDPAPGQIFLDGIERSEMPAYAWRRRVRYVSAEPGWWTDTPRLALPGAIAGSSRFLRLMAAVGLEEQMLDRQVSLLSTGERQRLALVRALADEPRALLLDEPTAALDPTASALVEEMIRYQMLAGRSVLLSSHDKALLGRLAHVRLQLAKQTPASVTMVAGT